jgi:hypothetical protein
MTDEPVWIECPECGEDLFAPDADGCFSDARERCSCGALVRLSCSDSEAYAMTVDE